MVDFIISAFTDELSPMLDEQLMTLKKYNTSHIELRNIDRKDISTLSNEEIRILSRKLEFDEVDVSAICSQVGRVGINDNFDNQLEIFKRTVEIANIIATTRVRISSFFIPLDEDYSNYHNKVIDHLGVLCEYAKSQGINTFVENEKFSYCDISNRMNLVKKELKEYVKFVFNPANSVLSGETPFECYSKVSEFIDYFYLKDALSDGSIVPIGEGICEIDKILNHYKTTYKNKSDVVLTLQSGLYIANDGVKYHYENENVAFDIAMKSLKSTLEKEGFLYI